MMTPTITWLGIGILFFAFLASLIYFITKDKIGKRTALLYALGIFFILSFSVILQELFGIPIPLLLILPGIAWGLIFGVFSWLVWPCQHGRRLVALAKPADTELLKVSAIFSLGLAILFMSQVVIHLIWPPRTMSQTDLWPALFAIFCFTQGLGSLHMGRRLADFWEHGFYSLGWFTPWSQVVSYRWDAANPEELIFRLKPHFPWTGARTTGLKVRPDMIAQAQQILDEKLPDRQRNFDDAEPNDAIDAT